MAQRELTISSKAQESLMSYIRAAAEIREEGWNLRARFEQVDRAYMRESDQTDEQRKAKAANRAGNPTKLQNMQVPMVLEAVENSTAFLSNVWLTDYPMFSFAADPEDVDLALQWNTLVGEDQIYYGWAGQFNIAFRNGEKYNFSPIEVEWKKNIRYKPSNGPGDKGVVLEEVTQEGNCVRAIDPYNTIYDPRVPICEMHKKGEFAGYVEQMTRIQLKIFLASLEGKLPNDRRAFESSIGSIQYYVPQINPEVSVANKTYQDGSFNWDRWANDEAQNHIRYKNLYTVTTLYARLMPFEFGIYTPRDQTPDIWKLVAVNDVLVYAKPVINAHDYLPVVIVQPLVDNLDHQTKASAENQQPFQEMVSALWNAKLASARRRTTDRMLYNPLLVDPDHINSPNPSAKIPVRPTAYGRKLEEAVYVFPFRDENSQFFLQEAQGISEWGMRVQGQNRVSMGQFQKGNKLENEFNTVMANAGARERTKAIMWETFGMQPIKEMLKSNYLQMAPSGTRYNRYERKEVEIDMVALRQKTAEFQVGDGLLPTEKLVSGQVMSQGFNLMLATPQISQEYRMGDLFAYLLKIQGVDKIDKFKKSPEQVQYEQALMAWQNAAAMFAEKSEMSPEDIQKAIGPMPQPPKPPQPNQSPNPTQQVIPSGGNPSAYLAA